MSMAMLGIDLVKNVPRDYFEERYRQRVLHNLAQRAQQSGMAMVPVAAQAAQTP